MSKTTYVIICGMHRSGTSMLAGALGLCGLDIGTNFRPPPYPPNNPNGYFEDLEFKRLNRKLMWKAGIGPGSFTFPQSFVIREQVKYREQMKDLVRRWDKGHPVGWKDPRACLTLLVWKRYIEKLKVIVIDRPAAEIAASLKTRNGFSADHSNKATKIYLARLKSALIGVDHMRVGYHNFFIDQRTRMMILLGLCDWIGIDPPDGWALKVEEFIDEKLWRHRC